ncbi:hypothetical protein FACS1894110_21260 [Spirochaetia bacterium]|nr:hypothetical protein FACS1894110_21260 [Spirochaetia bacterium]
MTDANVGLQVETDTRDLKKGTVEIHQSTTKIINDFKQTDKSINQTVKSFSLGFLQGAEQTGKVAKTLGKTISAALSPAGLALAAVTMAIKFLKDAITGAIKSQKEFADNIKTAGQAMDTLSGKTKALTAEEQKKEELDKRSALATAKIQQALVDMGNAISTTVAPVLNFFNGLWVALLENLGNIAVGIGTVLSVIGTVNPAFLAAGAALIAFGGSIQNVSDAEAEAALNAQVLKKQNESLVSSYGNLTSALKNTETAERSGAITAAEAAEGRLSANQSYLDSLIQTRAEMDTAAQKNGINATAELAALDAKIQAQVKERNNLKAIVAANQAAADAAKKAAQEETKKGDIISAYKDLQKQIAQQTLANNNAYETAVKLARDRNATEYELKKLEEDHAKANREIYGSAQKALLAATGLYNETRATAPITFGLVDAWGAIAAGEAEAVARSKEMQALMDEQTDALAEQEIARAKESNDILTAVSMQKELIEIQRQRARAEIEASEEFKAASKADQEAILADFARVTEGMKSEADQAIAETGKARESLLADQSDALAQIEIAKAQENKDTAKAIKLENDLIEKQRQREKERIMATAEYLTASDEERDHILKNFDAITAGMKKMDSLDVGKIAGDMSQIVSAVGSVADAMTAITDQMAQDQLASIEKTLEEMQALIDAQLESTLAMLDKERNAALEAAGFIKTTSEEGQAASMEAALASGDEAIIYREEQRQKELAINKEFDAKEKAAQAQADAAKKAAEEKAAREEAEIKYKAAMADWTMRMIMAPGQIAAGILSTIAQMGFPAAIAGIVAAGVAGAANIATLIATMPKKQAFKYGDVFAGGKNINFQGHPLKAYSSGGVVDTPTMFPMSNGNTGLLGEAGPEAIMPLGRDSSGALGVNAAGLGAGGYPPPSVISGVELGNLLIYAYSKGQLDQVGIGAS